ncbi:hypothetical protein COCOBI_17-0400 [Coccomyxa sp. Obi]|nr:hypothetical protein COCOBI_17-0400 [Coccomyxa sp. Obi]
MFVTRIANIKRTTTSSLSRHYNGDIVHRLHNAPNGPSSPSGGRTAQPGRDNLGTSENPVKLAEEPLPGIKLCIELHKKGSTAKKDSSMEMAPPYNIQAIYTYLEKKEDALTYEDINLWLLPNAELLDADLFEQKAHQHAAEGTPLLIEWDSASKACSALKTPEGLMLLGLPDEYDIDAEDVAVSSVDGTEALPESLCKAIPRFAVSGCGTIDDILNHFAEDLYLRQRVFDPMASSKEYSRRELISPILYCAACLTSGVAVRAEAAVKGQRSHGTVDWLLDHLGVSVICVEAKLHESLTDHVGQLCGEMRASRDGLKRKVLGKRKYDNISLSSEEEQQLDNLKKMPTIGLLSNAILFSTYKYAEVPLALVEFQRYILPSNMGTPICKFQEVKESMVVIVRHLMSLLESQIKDAAELLPEKHLKKARHL